MFRLRRYKKKSTCGQISLVFHEQYAFSVFKRLELYYKPLSVFTIDSVLLLHDTFKSIKIL